LDGVGLAPAGDGPDAHTVDLGFLGPSPFRCEDPRLWAFDFLGFPWILSSESRLINGLRGVKRGNFLTHAFPGVETPPGLEPAVLGHAEVQKRSCVKLTLISDFTQ
jgi:hypothetical protein